jgi:predicted ATPase
VLKRITESKEKRRKLTNLVKEALPFVENFGTESFADKSIMLKLRESYFKEYLPASLLSDGTIRVAALIVTLYFEEKKLVILEEPERNIHPHLISRLVNLMQDASQRKQIIVTSHNPMMVKYAGLQNILLVSRSNQGLSTITKPTEKEHVKEFMRHDMGIEELYVQDLLERPE